MRIPRPAGQRVLVENIKASDNINGLYIPEAHREQRPAEAVVVAIGKLVEIDVGGRNLGVGDRVFTERYNGQPVTVRGKPMRLLAPSDILAHIAND